MSCGTAIRDAAALPDLATIRSVGAAYAWLHSQQLRAWVWNAHRAVAVVVAGALTHVGQIRVHRFLVGVGAAGAAVF